MEESNIHQGLLECYSSLFREKSGVIPRTLNIFLFSLLLVLILSSLKYFIIFEIFFLKIPISTMLIIIILFLLVSRQEHYLSQQRHHGQGVERPQGILHVHAAHPQGLCQGPGLRQGPGAGRLRRAR